MIDQNGYIVSIWKQPDWTSNDVIKFLKPLISPLKVGHAGTLDPFAEGVLVLCAGKMTKQVSKIMDYEKQYLVDIQFGKRTDTLDCTGKVIKVKDCESLNKSKVLDVLKDFVGEIKQIPPMFSALKHQGQRLYSLARKGIRVEREARKIYIKNIDLINCCKDSISIKVNCGKGTYIRSLARDIAYSLNTEGYVSKLIRTKVGLFNKKNSINAQDFKDWLLYQQHIQN